jgi:hypothetical protein
MEEARGEASEHEKNAKISFLVNVQGGYLITPLQCMAAL